ncbi:MAG: hypothetical protein GY807_24850 [Gammaproteobacteria bacterium]|nr:hypothetical protein [Gammaproteobacteria bacterium]
MSTLSMSLELGAGPDDFTQRYVDKITPIVPGSRVKLIGTTFQEYPHKEEEKEWFIGYIGQENKLLQGSPQAEALNITAYGPEWLLAGKVVKGQWYANQATEKSLISNGPGASTVTRENIVQTDLECVFNEDNQPNMGSAVWATQTPGEVADQGGAVFVASNRYASYGAYPTTTAEMWTAYRALRSVVEWFDDYKVISPQTDWAAIKTLLSGMTLREVSIDGMTLLEAIRAILGPLGIGFKLDVVSDESERHVLRVYALKATKAGKTPYLPPRETTATSENGARGEVSRLELLRDSHNIRNAVTVVGDQERVQVELAFGGSVSDLWPSWDTANNKISDYMTGGVFAIAQVNPAVPMQKYHKSGSDFFTNQDVWRTFVFNEDGAGLDLTVYSESSIPTLSDYGLGEAMFRRPLGPMLSRNPLTGAYRNPLVTITVSGYTVDVSGQFEILKDRAGIRFKDDLFTVDTGGKLNSWRPFNKAFSGTLTDTQETLKNTTYLELLYNTMESTGTEMELKVVGTMESDKATKGEAARLNTSPIALDRERLVRVPAFRKYTVHDSVSSGEDTRNDSTAAGAYAKAVQYADDSSMGNASLMCRLSQAYPPGTTIAQTAGRVINLTVDGQLSKYAPVVRRCTHHFGETNVTEVLLDSPLLRLT